MGLCLHHSRRARALPLLAATAVLTALVAATAAQVASAGEPPCPSCPSRLPPAGSPGGGAGRGGAGSGGSAQPVQPLISLGPITVDNGVASVSGVVNASVGSNSANANVSVTVDAQPVSISAGGRFSAAVNLDAHAAVTVQAGDRSNGEAYSITIPASAIPAGGTPSDALVQLNADVVTLMLPADGFTIVDGVDITADVHVGNIAGIASLKLNGADLLAQLKVGSSSSSSGTRAKPTKPSGKPGSVSPPSGTNKPAFRHHASAKVSGAAKNVKLSVKGTNGASQTTTVRIQRIRSVIRFGRQISISAFGARGIHISAIRFNTSGVARTGRLGVTVTVRDRRHYLIRDAVVMLQPLAHRVSISGSLAQMSNLLGRTTFTVPVAGSALGHRLYLTVIARTPRSSTQVTTSTFLCGCQ